MRNGISVLSSVNLLHVEEYKDNVQAITGKNTTETIPKSFLLAADDIVIVGVPPEWTSRAVIKSHKFLWRTHTPVFERLLSKNFTEDIVRLAQDLQVTVVADRSRRQAAQ